MKQQHADYQVAPCPKMRRWFAAAFRSAQHKPMMHGLIEVDVTRAREFLREHKAKTVESLSFRAFLIACLAKAVDEHKAVQAIRFGSKRLILFEEVDVYTFIEPDDQFRSRYDRRRPGSALHRAVERTDRKRLWSFRLHGRAGAGRSGSRIHEERALIRIGIGHVLAWEPPAVTSV